MSGGKTCHYYLQGNCKFGSSCRFSHSDGGGHRDYHDEYQPKHNKNGSQQFYGGTNRNYNYSEREDYRNTNRYEKHNYNYDGRNNNEYEQNNPHYNYYDNRRNNQYEQNNHQYDRSNSQQVKKNYNRRNNHYEEQNNYNNNYDNYNNDNKHKNNYQSPKNYNANSSIENNGKNNSNSQYNNKHIKNKNEDYDKQPNYVNNIESFKNDYRNQTTSNRNKNYSNDDYDNNYKTEQDDASKKEKMKKLYKNEIKIYQIQMKQMLENNYWPFTCYNPIGQSPIVEPVGSLNLMEASFEEIRCDYYNVKNICASPEMIHKQVYDELLLKAKKQKEDIVNLKDFVLNDLIATFQKWEEAKLNPTIKNVVPVDENVYWDMSSKRLKTPSDSKTLLDSFSFVLSDEVTDTNDKGPKILMQTEVYGRMENGFDEEDFIDYVPIIPPPQKHCL